MSIVFLEGLILDKMYIVKKPYVYLHFFAFILDLILATFIPILVKFVFL